MIDCLAAYFRSHFSGVCLLPQNNCLVVVDRATMLLRPIVVSEVASSSVASGKLGQLPATVARLGPEICVNPMRNMPG